MLSTDQLILYGLVSGQSLAPQGYCASCYRSTTLERLTQGELSFLRELSGSSETCTQLQQTILSLSFLVIIPAGLTTFALTIPLLKAESYHLILLVSRQKINNT